MTNVTVAGQSLALEAASVTQVLRTVAPEPIRDHYVMIGGRRFPPKQALEQATGIDRADFTTHQARSILRKLGFEVGRLSDARARERATSYSVHEARSEASPGERPDSERWIAVKDGTEIAHAPTAHELIETLRARGARADTMYRVSPPIAEEPLVVE